MSEELTIWENIKNSRVVIQYFILILVISAINMVLNSSYGDLNETFFCVDTSQGFMNSKKILWMFSFLIFIFIVGVREWTRRVEYAGTTLEERKEEFKDFMLYVVICLSSFVFAGAYIRDKFSVGQGGGGDGLTMHSVTTLMTSQHYR